MIKLVRIDDRLIHGQIAFAWTAALGVDTFVIANDAVSKNEFLKMTLDLAKPRGAKLLIKTVEDSIAFLKDPKNSALKVLLIINNVEDAYALACALDEIQSINFGGIRSREGAKLISQTIALTAADIETVHKLLEKEVELEIRQVPSDKKQFVKNLIK